MSTLQLNQEQLQKLTHESAEIRLRALEQVELRFQRSLEHNETIAFKPVLMTKQLIRWFGRQPLQHAERVLGLLLQLLRSSYATIIFRKMKCSRLKNEFEKVHRIVANDSRAMEIVSEIILLLEDQPNNNTGTEEDNTVTPRHTAIPQSLVSQSSSSCSNIVLSTNTSDEQNSASTVSSECSAQVVYSDDCYEVPWSRPAVSDVTCMKSTADIFSNTSSSSEELQNTLMHLQFTMRDYPAEYLLQTPHIYQKLLKLHDRNTSDSYCMALLQHTLLLYLEILAERIVLRRQLLNYSALECPGSLSTMPKVQLKPETAVRLLLDSCLAHLAQQSNEFQAEQWQIFELLRLIFKIYQQLQVAVPANSQRQLAMLSESMQRQYMDTKAVNIPRLKYLLLAELLQGMVQHSCDLDADTQHQMLEYLLPLSRDYAFHLCFPECMESLLLRLSQRNYKNFNGNMEQLKVRKDDYTLALRQLNQMKQMTSEKLILAEESIFRVLEPLGSQKLVKILFNAIIDCNARYANEPTLLQHAELLLDCLLRLRNERLRLTVHKLLRQHILRHFHCLMNRESYVAGMSNKQLVAAGIVGVPLNLALLRTIITHSHEDASEEIQQISIDCLCLLLKTESLLGDNFQHVVNLLVPLMPLLICRACKNEELLRLLLQLHDPDASCLQFLHLLRGNICFLFHPTPSVRNEAVSRLVYILNCHDQARQLLPDLEQVRELLTDDICLVLPPRDYRHVFNAPIKSTFRDQHIMLNLCELLDSSEIEPLIRKTTLMQLNVMLQSWQAALTFAEFEAFVFPLNALKNALLQESAVEYNDAAIPAVGMLLKLFFVNKEFRHHIAETEDLYMLLLRALFHFHNDIQVRQDASLCLFQLLFDEYMRADETDLKLPKLVSNLLAPVTYSEPTCNLTTDPNDVDKEIVLHYFGGSHTAAQNYWRLHIATLVCESFEHIKLDAISALDISDTLKLQKHELMVLQATQTQVQLRRYLNAGSNATEHLSLIRLIDVLKLYLVQLRGNVLPELSAMLYTLMAKYLHLQPGNALDYQLFEQMLELCDLAICLGLQPVIDGLSAGLQADVNHALMAMLRQRDTQLRLYKLITSCLTHLLIAHGSFSTPTNNNLWFGSCFEMLFQLAREQFETRELQRVRGVLTVLSRLSERNLALADQTLYAYCRQCMRLSYDLKVFTQTGAQWQRDCLRIVNQLHAQMDRPAQHFRFRTSVMKLLSGLCGHNDAQVRALAWISLAGIANSYATGDEGKKGSAVMLQELKFLPGGFLACCLSTLQDHHETTLVRQIAGRVFMQLSKDCPVEETLHLLERHAFLSTALEALTQSALVTELPLSIDVLRAGKLDSCEVIGCYVRICVHMLALQPEWSQKLCGHAFMQKLYEIFKLPPTPLNGAYRRLSADICELYARCYVRSFAFLQRTLCRDPVLLQNFVKLLDDMNAQQDDLLLQMVKLLMIFCKDETSYWYICQEFSRQPAVPVNLCLRAFKLQNVNTPLQRDTLSVLTLLLIRAQQADTAPDDNSERQQDAQLTEHSSLVTLLEQHTTSVSRSSSAMTLATKVEKENEINSLCKELSRISINAAPSNQCANGKISVSNKSRHTSPTRSVATTAAVCEEQNAATSIYIDLDRLFSHIYPLKSCRFTQPPSQQQVQVCRALGVLLKLSPYAQTAARNLRLLDRILDIVNNFLGDFNMPTTTFVRRNGDHKTLAITNNLSVLFEVIFHWHCSHHAVLTDELQTLRLVKALINIWPWMAHSAQLKLIIMNACAFLSEHSLVVCKQMSVLIPNFTHSMLQLVAKHVNFQTTAVRALSTDSFAVIERGLRIMSNCCACAEGRLSLAKLHVLDIFDALLSSSQSKHVRPEILHAWLRFWEIYSRYEAGGKAIHLQTLLSTVQRSQPRSMTRLLCLRILRNMCFLPTNRGQMVTMTELMGTIDDIVNQPMHEQTVDVGAGTNEPRTAGGGTGVADASAEYEQCYEEQRLVNICLWKLFGSGARYKAMLRGTRLAKHLRILREQLATIAAEQPQRMRRLRFAQELAEELDLMFEALTS